MRVHQTAGNLFSYSTLQLDFARLEIALNPVILEACPKLTKVVHAASVDGARFYDNKSECRRDLPVKNSVCLPPAAAPATFISFFMKKSTTVGGFSLVEGLPSCP